MKYYKKIVHILLFILSLTWLCSAGSAGSTPVNYDEKSAEEEAAGDKRRQDRNRKKAKQADLRDPGRLEEIINRAIQAGETPNSHDSAGLELPVTGTITSKTGLRQDPIDGTLRIHNGIDIAVPEGTPVKPVAAGKVIYSGFQPGYGNMVIVRHDDGMVTIYAHHSRNTVRPGDFVDRKTGIARSGSTGRSTGPHLHFEAWQGGKNVTRAFLPDFAGFRIAASSDASLAKTNLRKVIMSDGTILFIEMPRARN